MTITKSRKIAASLCLVGLLIQPGCNDASNPSTDPPIPSVPVVKTGKDPLTEAELTQFFEIISQLPGGKVPEFQPIEGPPVDEQLPPAKLVHAFQREFRDQLDPIQQGKHMRQDPKLVKIFQEHGLTPEEFAALVTRIIFAVSAAEVLPAPDEASELVEKAHQRLDALITTGSPANVSGTAPASRRADAERQAAVVSIRRTVAFLEYVELARSVPEASCKVVRRNRAKLQELLPDLDHAGEQFDTWSREFGDVAPAGFSR